MRKFSTIIIILIIIVAAYLLLRGGYKAPTPPPAEEPIVSPTLFGEPTEEPISETVSVEARRITVSGTEFSFSPSSLIFTSGEKIKLTFNNTGSVPHNLTIKGTSIATKTIAGGKTDTIEFTVPASGTYEFFCSIAGHRELGMEGTLEVE